MSIFPEYDTPHYRQERDQLLAEDARIMKRRLIWIFIILVSVVFLFFK